MERAQKKEILRDLDKKMVLLVGPRQVGKTWLARSISSLFKHSVYLNYDQTIDREVIINQSWLMQTELLVLDELHKMPNWKNYLKGVYDTKPAHLRILVTGSARLDIYDQIGDSLAGRYFRHRLLPFSLSELSLVTNDMLNSRDAYEAKLLSRGGFPEPFFAETDLEAERWRMQYINGMLSTEVFEFDRIQNIKAMRLIFQLLRERVGSPISYRSLSGDVGVSPTTVKQYIQILEALFIVFRVTPYSKNIARSLLKEPKLYFFDTGLVQGDMGVRLENFVAVSLLKQTYARVDYLAQDCELNYLRTKEGYEVDFAITINGEIESMMEVKLSDRKPSKSLLYFKNKYGYPAIQLVHSLRQEYQIQGVNVLNSGKFLRYSPDGAS
jgi:predicted AAA+ superfamily ATPase